MVISKYMYLVTFTVSIKTKKPKLKKSVSCYSTLKSYMQSKRWKVIVPDLQMPRGVASLLWQSTESFNSRQRAHDGSGPMGFKRINIQVTASRGASWGQHCIVDRWEGKKTKTKIIWMQYTTYKTIGMHINEKTCLKETYRYVLN